MNLKARFHCQASQAVSLMQAVKARVVNTGGWYLEVVGAISTKPCAGLTVGSEAGGEEVVGVSLVVRPRERSIVTYSSVGCVGYSSSGGAGVAAAAATAPPPEVEGLRLSRTTYSRPPDVLESASRASSSAGRPWAWPAAGLWRSMVVYSGRLLPVLAGSCRLGASSLAPWGVRLLYDKTRK